MRVVFESPVKLMLGYEACPMGLTIGAYTYSYSMISRFVGSIGRYCSIGAVVGFGEMEHEATWLTTSNVTYDPKFWNVSGWPEHQMPLGRGDEGCLALRSYRRQPRTSRQIPL